MFDDQDQQVDIDQVQDSVEVHNNVTTTPSLLGFLGMTAGRPPVNTQVPNGQPVEQPVEQPEAAHDGTSNEAIGFVDLLYHAGWYCLFQPLVFISLMFQVPTKIFLLKQFVQIYFMIIIGSAILGSLLIFFLTRVRHRTGMYHYERRSILGHLFMTVWMIGMSIALELHTLVLGEFLPLILDFASRYLSQLG